MEFNANCLCPFGPPILEADCPDFIVDSLNEYVDTYDSRPNARKNFPNLLNRSISNIFIETDFADDIGLLDYMEYLADEYVKFHSIRKAREVRDRSEEEILSKFDRVAVSELSGDEEGLIDAWVNVYGETDFTPVHSHGGELSAIIILKIPEDPEGVNNTVNHANEPCPNGKLNFHYHYVGGNLGLSEFDNEMYAPDQYVGKTIIFPPGLRHLYYPHKLNGQERRTLSLNYAIDYVS